MDPLTAWKNWTSSIPTRSRMVVAQTSCVRWQRHKTCSIQTSCRCWSTTPSLVSILILANFVIYIRSPQAFCDVGFFLFKIKYFKVLLLLTWVSFRLGECSAKQHTIRPLWGCIYIFFSIRHHSIEVATNILSLPILKWHRKLLIISGVLKAALIHLRCLWPWNNHSYQEMSLLKSLKSKSH